MVITTQERHTKITSQERKAIIRERLDALRALDKPVHGGKVRKWKDGDANGTERRNPVQRRLC